MKDFFQLTTNLKRDFSGLIPVKLALLGDSSTQFLQQALRGMAYDRGMDLQIFEADFNQVERQAFDRDSELYAYKPEIVVIFQSTERLHAEYNYLAPAEKNKLAEQRLALVKELYKTISVNLSAKVIYYNYAEINDAVFGNYSNKLDFTFLFQQRKLNYELMNFASLNSDFYICDLLSIQNQQGRNFFFHPSTYINAEMVLSLDVLPLVAASTLDIISALKGKFKKCLVLDLDNTLWGGIIGDDGMENIQLGNLGIGKAFTEFQHWIKKLKERGIILAVCSKNTHEVAMEPFEKHPDMVLRPEDIAVFVANWENKVDNIRYIQNFLNIGFDSMVFLDDNPFERAMVQENIPEITVPHLPEDPAEFLGVLYALNLFETTSYSREDSERNASYRIETERLSLSKTFTNENEFLRNLDMESVVENFTRFNTPRVAQLSQRSNQFNLRTLRYTESILETISGSNNYFPFAFSLRDKFGDYGLICVVVLKEEKPTSLFIESWFMSCRVLKRGMEQFVLNTISDFALSKGFEYLRGEYLPTEKNGMVRDHYLNLGFKEEDGSWFLDLKSYQTKETCISIVKKYEPGPTRII
ncbi:MAG: HAD family hydrolase [Bacteroidia bacterium]|nr:HAD family hydrolase [Bacteroidia bacterium]